MAKKSNTEYLKRIRGSIESSRKWRKQDGYDATWTRMKDLYRGRHFDDYINQDQMLVNIAFSTVNVISPTISVNYPKITVSAVASANAGNAVIAEAVVNYWWRRGDVRSEFRRAVKDVLVAGHGWIKVGYRFVEESKVADDELDVTDPVSGGEGHTEMTIREDAPFAERVSVHDIFVDPDATTLKEAKWVAQRIRRPIEEVKKDERYNKVVRAKVLVAATSKYSDDPSRKKIKDKEIGYAEIWEYYDIRKGTMSIFSESGDGFLVEPTKMPYSFGQPFVMIRNYDIPDMFYPMGDLESIEPLQRELNETRSQMMNHRKKFSRKYLYKEGSFDTLGRNALESDEDNVMVPVISDEPLLNVVTAFPAIINPPEFYNQSSMIIGDIDRISGVSDFQRGTSDIRRTATESSLLQDAANARTSDKLSVIEQAIAEVGRRMMQLAQQYMTGEAVARVTGKDGEPMWVTYDRDWLQGDFDFEVAAGSTQPHNESFKRQSALQMMDTMAPFLQMGVIDAAKLAAYLLQFGFGVKNPDEFMMQAPQGAAGPDGAPAAPGAPQGPMGAPQGAPASGLPPELVAALQQSQGQEQPAPQQQ